MPGSSRSSEPRGSDKFIASEIPIDFAKLRCAGRFDMVVPDLGQSDDLRVLDFNGEPAFRLLKLTEPAGPIVQEP